MAGSGLDSAEGVAVASGDPVPKAPRNARTTAFIVACALIMQNLDSSVIATALPAMARDLGVEPLHLSAAITSYLVALTVFIPLSGWVADRFGAKRVFMVAIAVFAFASALCGLSRGLGELVAARVLQGLGGAMMVPVARLLLMRQVRPEEVVRATTWLTMPGLLGPIFGPPLGGFLTDAASWRAVFWINLPIAALGLLAVWRFIPASREARPPRLDLVGVSLVGAALAALMFGAETVGRGMLPGWVPVLGFALGMVLAWMALRWVRRAPNPAVDLSLFSIPSFRIALASGSLFRIGAGAVPFLLPLLLQLGFGASATASGLVTLASALGAFAMKPMTSLALRRFGFRNVLVWNAVIVAGSLLVCASFAPGWPLWAVFIVLALAGLVRSLQFTASNALTYADLPPGKLSAGTSVAATAQQLFMALGVTWGAGWLAASAAIGGHAEPEVVDFAVAFIGAALPVLLAAPVAARLAPDAGGKASGHKPRG
ncbi:MFS transporter [Roseomonas xinghualingensis]|uniref:MFS transporter n=1 Tax=Roseomonas xinghualingensis TaxID=2986475 RepID=UPI0021F16642|nr:MFS transporter [Roseomonas sp. SXEYE001]MCV4209285.1 MFS transporter [Roseomonas sp. SXEYE001]